MAEYDAFRRPMPEGFAEVKLAARDTLISAWRFRRKYDRLWHVAECCLLLASVLGLPSPGSLADALEGARGACEDPKQWAAASRLPVAEGGGRAAYRQAGLSGGRDPTPRVGLADVRQRDRLRARLEPSTA